MGITINMIEKDIIWHNDHHQQAIRELILLQQQLFNQRIERNKYYKRKPNNKSDEQKKLDDWKNMVNIERCHVKSKKEVLEKLVKENPKKCWRTILAWAKCFLAAYGESSGPFEMHLYLCSPT